MYDTMPTGPDAPPEHIILDENIKAQEYDYYSIGAFKVRRLWETLLEIDFDFKNCVFLLTMVFRSFNAVFRLVQIINWWPMQRTQKAMRYIQ